MESSYLPVAKLTILPHNAYGNERQVYADKVLSFNLRHMLLKYQMFGSIQRGRRPIYDECADDRHQMNAQKQSPTSIAELPN